MQATANQPPQEKINHPMQKLLDGQSEDQLHVNVKQEPKEIYDDPNEPDTDWPIGQIDTLTNPIQSQYPISEGIFGIMKHEGIPKVSGKGATVTKAKGRKSTPRKRQIGSKKNMIPLKIAKQEDLGLNQSELAADAGGFIDVSQFIGLINDNNINEEDDMENSNGLKTEDTTESEPVLLHCPHCDFTHLDKYRYRYHLYTKHNDLSAGKPRIHQCDKCDYLSFR